MKMRNYYYVLWGDFRNTYNLCKAPSNVVLPDNWKRISRKEAYSLCTEERERRKFDSSSAFYAPVTVRDYLDVISPKDLRCNNCEKTSLLG